MLEPTERNTFAILLSRLALTAAESAGLRECR